MFTDYDSEKLFSSDKVKSGVFGRYYAVDDCYEKENLYNKIILLPNYEALKQSARKTLGYEEISNETSDVVL